MKKIILGFLTIAMTLGIAVGTAGCNYQLIDMNYKYTHAYIKIGEEWKDLEIKSWHDYDGEQLQITLKDGTVMLVSSYYCILYNGTLPA